MLNKNGEDRDCSVVKSSCRSPREWAIGSAQLLVTLPPGDSILSSDPKRSYTHVEYTDRTHTCRYIF